MQGDTIQYLGGQRGSNCDSQYISLLLFDVLVLENVSLKPDMFLVFPSSSRSSYVPSSLGLVLESRSW